MPDCGREIVLYVAGGITAEDPRIELGRIQRHGRVEGGDADGNKLGVGHSNQKPAAKRQRFGVQRIRSERDPIDRMREFLIAGDHAGEAALKEIDREIKKTVTAAAEFAQSSPEPLVEELYTDVLVSA